MIIRLCIVAAAAAALSSHAFVFYRVAGNVLRWNVANPGLHPNVVNPATKAIRYYIASDAWSATNKNAEIDAIRAAFDQWQAAPGTNVKFEFAGLVSPENLDTRFDNTNVVYWTKKTLLVAGGFENLSGRRAWTSVSYSVDGSILDADIVLNGIQYRWFTDYQRTNSQEQFVEATVLHEIGHFLGLDHTPAGGGTVINGAVGVATETGLSADEIAAIRFLNPAPGSNWASIQGTVRMNNAAVFGAMVIVEDAAGNIAGATVSDASGAYLVPSLAPGEYKLRVCPFDHAGSPGLLRPEEIASDYRGAQTSFLPTSNLAFTVAAGQARTQDVTVISGEPATRLLGLSKPTPDESFVTFDRLAVSIRQGQSNYFTGVISRTLKADAVLTIPGDGISMGPSVFLKDKFGAGIHAIVARISVSSNAAPGLRSFVLTHSTGTAYANGYLEVAPAIADYNFDGLDDRFQRQYWSLWTTNAAAPAADPDADLFSNRYEYRVGTHPLDPASRALRLGPVTSGRFGETIQWPADLGRRYQISATTNLTTGWQVFSTVTATNETMAVLDASGSSAKFYKLQLLP